MVGVSDDTGLNVVVSPDLAENAESSRDVALALPSNASVMQSHSLDPLNCETAKSSLGNEDMQITEFHRILLQRD